MQLRLTNDDITRFDGDAIVNAANPALAGGGGVDGAIHRAAGPELAAACAALPWAAPRVRCPPGEVRITPGFRLPARWVIHTVGPIWRETPGAPRVLAACYREALGEAEARRWSRVAFPAISCGVNGYPLPAAAAVAMSVVFERDWRIAEVTFALPEARALAAWKAARLAADQHLGRG